MKKKFIFLGLLFSIQVPLLCMERVFKNKVLKEKNLESLKILSYYNQIIDNYNQVNQKIKENPYCLLEAAKKDDVKKAIDLIKAGADLNIQNNNGYTALYIAALLSRVEIAKALIDAGVNLDIQSTIYGETALYAAADKNVEIVKALIEAGANLNIKNHRGYTALHKAVYWNKIKIVEKLINANANLYIKNNEEKTALRIATDRNNREIVRLIKNRITLAKIEGNPYCLIEAVRNNDIEQAKDLIKAGADLNIQDGYGRTALHIAAATNEETLHELISAGADLNIQDDNGCTALHMASWWNKMEVVKALIKAGADSNIQNNNKETALHVTVKYNKKQNNISMVETLINARVNLDIQDDYGWTVLHHAIHDNKFNVDINVAAEVLENKEFIMAGINLELGIENNNAWTALHGDIVNKNVKIVQKLINAGANLNIQTDREKTALQLASLMNNTTIVRLINDRIDFNNRNKEAISN